MVYVDADGHFSRNWYSKHIGGDGEMVVTFRCHVCRGETRCGLDATEVYMTKRAFFAKHRKCAPKVTKKR